MRLKPSKCKMGYSSIQFMGAVLDGSKRGIDPHKVKVFALMWRPKTGKEVQKVLGYLNFLRDFIPLYANIVGPMEGLRSAKVISNDLWKESGGKVRLNLLRRFFLRRQFSITWTGLWNSFWRRTLLSTELVQFCIKRLRRVRGMWILLQRLLTRRSRITMPQRESCCQVYML